MLHACRRGEFQFEMYEWGGWRGAHTADMLIPNSLLAEEYLTSMRCFEQTVLLSAYWGT